MRFQWKKLYLVLSKYRVERGVSWRALGAEYEILPSVFTRISQDKAVGTSNLINLLKMARAYDDGLSFLSFVR